MPTEADPSPGFEAPELQRSEQAAAPSQIGPYRILDRLGAGGMGEVYVAEQTEPVKRRVALKLIKLGMDSHEVVARFRQEQQALALMSHDSIAKVFDVGTTERGQPYFVMELVKGVPLDEYCDTHRLALPERIGLMQQVCAAITHAHQKGVVHRDLKPSNVLVSDEGGVARVKVIDFGLAKAMGPKLTDASLFTEAGQILGTPGYMAPEQADPTNVDVDTRADVYSLGVILYKLLVGEPPFSNDHLWRGGFMGVLRVLREEEPLRPSQKLSSMGPATTKVCGDRRMSSAALRRTLQTDLDWVVLKALEKDRNRRYDSPAALAAELQRYLDHEPLLAGPPSAWYRTQKLLRRYRGQAIALGAVTGSLIAGFGTAMWQADVAADERDVAILAGQRESKERARADERAVAAEKAEKAERERAQQLKQVSDFQSQMLRQIDTTAAGIGLMRDIRERYAGALEKAGVPESDRMAREASFRTELSQVNATDTAAAMIDRNILKPAVETIEKQFKNQPLVDAQLRHSLVVLYTTIGLDAAALALQESALATRRRVLGEEHQDTLQSISNMGFLLLSQGKLAEAEPYVRNALEGRRRILGEDHPDTITSISNLGVLLRSQGKLADSEPFIRETLEKSRRVLGQDHPDTLTAVNNMGFMFQSQGKFSEAEPYYSEALEKRRRMLPEDHPDTLISIQNLGSVLRAQSKLSEAEPYTLEALEKCRRLLGEEHPNTLIAINNIGSLLLAQGKVAEAEPYYREALEKRRRVLGNEHASTLKSLNNLGSLLRNQGKLAEAEICSREAWEKSSRILGKEHLDTLIYLINLGVIVSQQGKYQEAVEVLTPSEPATRRAFSAGNAPWLASFLLTLGRAQARLAYGAERFRLAESHLAEAHALLTKTRGEGHKDTVDCMQGLVDLYTAWNAAEPESGYGSQLQLWKDRLNAQRPKNAVAPDAEKK